VNKTSKSSTDSGFMSPNSKPMTGKVALVTGGSRGIGAANWSMKAYFL
jgi:hypothetical protein